MTRVLGFVFGCFWCSWFCFWVFLVGEKMLEFFFMWFLSQISVLLMVRFSSGEDTGFILSIFSLPMVARVSYTSHILFILHFLKIFLFFMPCSKNILIVFFFYPSFFLFCTLAYLSILLSILIF
jgi:hypothetical protein